MVKSPLFVGEFDPEDFSPVKINELPKPLDELSEPKLRNYVVELRRAVNRERQWQDSVGLMDESRLIRLADLYVEAQEYYAQFNPKLRERMSSSDYVPVLRLQGRIW